MTIGMLQSTVFGDLFGTAAMRDVFGEEALFRNCAIVEAALARAQGRLGIIPAAAAEAISKAIAPIAERRESLDLERLKRETATVGFPILPLVRQLADRVGEAGRYLHWGATTQDIMDSAAVLQIRDGLALIESDLTALRGHLAALAKQHRDTPMYGRTFLQQALPITFGYKVAVWLSAFDRHAERLGQLKQRVLIAEFGGAVGTLASLGSGDEALRTVGELARELGLAEPAITWHVARDTIAETVQFLALLGGSLAKIADDVMLMSATEFGEAGEPFEVGRGASSTMPQKRNPISCGLIAAAARALRQHAGLALPDAMLSSFERTASAWRPRMDRRARGVRLCRWRAAPERVPCRRAHPRAEGHGKKSGSDARPHRRRGGDDGPRAAYRAQRGTRPRLRFMPRRDRAQSPALRRADGDKRGRRAARCRETKGVDRPGKLSRRGAGHGRPRTQRAVTALHPVIARRPEGTAVARNDA